MEKKKRSTGVTLFAWSFIILNFIGLITVPSMTQSYSFLAKSALSWTVIYALIISLAGIVAGISLLMLKEWARRLTLVLIILGFLEMILFVPLNHRSVEIMAQDPKMIAMFEKQYDSMPAADKAKIPISKEEFLKQVAKMSTKATLVLTGILEGIIVIYLFILLWFFTKINVRRQFG